MAAKKDSATMDQSVPLPDFQSEISDYSLATVNDLLVCTAA